MEPLRYTGTTPYIPTTSGDLRLSGSGTITTSSTLTTGIYNLTNNTIMQNKVAVFKVTRDKDDKITKTEFIKELWVETKNGQSVDFQVARDKDLADYEMSDLSIRTLSTISF